MYIITIVHLSALRLVFHSPHSNGGSGEWVGGDDDQKVFYFLYSMREHTRGKDFSREQSRSRLGMGRGECVG